MGRREGQEGKPGAFLPSPGWRVVTGNGHHTGDLFTFHVSHEDVSICPLVNPVLEGAAFEHNLRGASCHQAAIPLSDTVLLAGPAEVLLHCGIRDVVGRAINQVQRNYPAWEFTDNVSMVTSPSFASGDLHYSLQPCRPFAFLPISLPFVGVECTVFGMPHHPQGIFPPPPAMLCQGIKPVELQHITYSGTAPKSGMARASAAKILQYSRLEFWTLHSWKCKQKSQEPVPSCTNASLGPLPSVSLSWWSKGDGKVLHSSTLLRWKS